MLNCSATLSAILLPGLLPACAEAFFNLHFRQFDSSCRPPSSFLIDLSKVCVSCTARHGAKAGEFSCTPGGGEHLT